MAFDGTKWTVNGLDVRYIGGAHGTATASYETVIDFHRWLQDLADDAVATGDDILDITDDTPSERSTDNIITLINGYNIDQTASEHLYDGSIIQANGDDIWDGIVNFGNEGIDIQIIQNGAIVTNDFWNSLPNGETLTGLNRNLSAGISHRFMLKTKTSGTIIDGGRMVGISREFGKTYSEFSINGTSRGNNVLALVNSNDISNETPAGTVATWSTISNTQGYRSLDIDNNGTPENYYSEWNRDTYTINQLYERTKWIQACESGTTNTTPNATIYGLGGNLFRGITHVISGTQSAGTFVEPSTISWGTGTGQLLAVDSTTAATKIYIQLLTGVAPINTDVVTGGGTFTASGSISKSISSTFIGQSTGSSLIGAYGVGVEPTDLSASDKVTDLTGATITPPNYVTFTVSGIVHNEDRVLVAPDDGAGGIDESQLTLSGALTSGVSTTATMTTAIPSDTPASGTIRIFNGSTFFRQPYTSWTGSVFTLDGTALASASDAANVFISYIDELATGSVVLATALIEGTEYEIKTVGTTDFTLLGASSNTVGTRFFKNATAGTGPGDAYAVSTTAKVTSVYNANRDLFVRVRDGGSSPIKTYESGATLGSAGGSSSAIRTNDY